VRQRIDVLLSVVRSEVRVGGHLRRAVARWASMAPLISVVAARACVRGVIGPIVVAVILDVVVAVSP
jgi:hypothetical protein